MHTDIGYAENAQDLPGVVDQAMLYGEVTTELPLLIVCKDAKMGNLTKVTALSRVLCEVLFQKASDGRALERGEEVIGLMGYGHGFLDAFS
jgi:hypothetical protein